MTGVPDISPASESASDLPERQYLLASLLFCVAVLSQDVTAAPIEDDDERRAVVVELHEHLAATAERPIERTASRWIGEAEAIAADLVEAPSDPALIRERVGHIASLLAEVEDTEDEAADEHVEAATRLADRLRGE